MSVLVKINKHENGYKKGLPYRCTAVLFILLQLFKHQKAEGDGCGELRQSRKAGGTVAGRFQ